MKIKRFFSSDMRSVIRMVREELGADAVILSNSRVNGGVEVVAAIDYDESIFTDDKSKNTPAPASQGSSHQELPSQSPATQEKAKPLAKGRAAPVTARTEYVSDEPEETGFAQLHESSPIDPLVNKPAKRPGPAKTSSAPVSQRKQSRSGAGSAGQSHLEKHQLVHSGRDEFDDLSDQQKKDSDFSFYLLGDDEEGTESLEQQNPIEESLFDTSRMDSSTADTAPDFIDEAEYHSSSKGSSVWSQEPTLVEMRKDIQTLRGLLEQQLTGLAWGDLARKNPVRAKLLRQLLELDISPPLAGKISDAAGKYASFEKAWQASLNLVTHNLLTISDDMITEGGIVALVGPTGVGKTTTVAKLAARYALRHGRNRVALVTTDSFRIAAHEQLRTYGRILGMPVRIATDKDELVEILKSFSDKDLILIDTAGMSHRDVRLVEQFSMITDSAPSIKSLLVMSATTHRSGLDEIVRVFRNVDLDGCVLTKIDETTGLAGCLSVAIEHRLPVAYVGNGQKVPEDLHLARAHSLVNQSVLIARKTNQPMGDESLELAFSRVKSNAYV